MLVYDTNARRYFAEWFGTREEYDNLPVKANNTKYCVREVSGDASFYFFGYDDTILEGAKRDGTVNVKDLSTFDEWIGTEGEFSAITNRRGNTKYAVTNNNIVTNFVKVADKPDNRISLSVAGGPFGLELWNNPNDPMPIKTINMAGLQKWEETDDYIIYLDKDAVMTTVESYVTGTYDLFRERKNDIDGAMELLKINNIEWTSEDDSKLIIDINKAQLERIANTPTTIEDEDFAPQTFTTRAVPTTYECCFRVDKKTGEIYIGEGYENLFKPNNVWTSSGVGFSVTHTRLNDGWTKVVMKLPNGDHSPRIESEVLFPKGTAFFELKIKNNKSKFKAHVWADVLGYGGTEIPVGDSSTLFKANNMGDLVEPIRFNIVKEVLDLEFEQLCFATKTSTPKPFVKSIMPSGKLVFVTGATSESHSFILHEYIVNRSTTSTYPKYCRIFSSVLSGDITKTYRLAWSPLPVEAGYNKTNILASKTYKNFPFTEGSTETSGSVLNLTGPITNEHGDSFKQLLIYKGNLTEAELKAENEKDIRLK